MKSAEQTDWLDNEQLDFWFERFKSADADGLRFGQFQEFLKATLYLYFVEFPTQASNPPIQYHDKVAPSTKAANNQQQDDESHHFTTQQEMRLFKTFDLKNDHVLDRDEFNLMCTRWLHLTYQPSCGLIIVDVQNDFIDGSLALINGPAKQDGASVLPVINELIGYWQQHSHSQAAIVYTQDWHPPDHIGFHANLHLRKHVPKEVSSSPQDSQTVGENGARTNVNGQEQCQYDQDNSKILKYKKFLSKIRIFDTVLFDDGRVEQKMWPTHCVQSSWGAQLHPKLRQVPDAIRIQKGTLSHVDAYSAFWDNMRSNETGLKQELVGKKVNDLFFCGLALDYCVAASALDAIKEGFVTFVVEDACRGIDEQEIEARKRELLENGAFILQSCHVKEYLMINQQNNHIVANGWKTMLDRDFIKAVAFRRATLVTSTLSYNRIS